MKDLFTATMNYATEIIKTIPLIFLQSETDFLLGGRAKQGLFQPINDPYTEHAWVYAAINSISLNVASVPYVIQNDQGPVATSRWHPLFENPNPDMGWGQFVEAITIWMHLRGEAMIILERTSMFDVPTGMMPVDPAFFEPITNEKGDTLLGWKIIDGAKEKKFQLHEILQIKFFNPNDPWRGLSPMSAARSGINQDALANRFNTVFFENSGSPGGVVEVPGVMTDTQFNRFRSQLKDRHQGLTNAHKMMLLEGDARYKQQNISQKDMDFLNQKKWNRDEILAVFKVPKMEVGVWDDVNFAIAKVQAREFWLKNLIPKMDIIEWAFWNQLFSKVGGGRTWAEFDTSGVPALQDELDTKIDMAFKLWQMGWPANQINKRLRLQMDDNEWQNTAYIPVNIQAIGEDGIPIPQVENTPPDEDPLQPPKGGGAGKQIEPSDLFNRLKKFFYNQRTRQLKVVNSNKPLTIGEEEEILKMVAQTGLKESTVIQINDAVKYILDKSATTNTVEMKEVIRIVYNKIEEKLPDIISMIEKE